MRAFGLTTLALTLGLLLGASPASATVIVPMSVEEMANEAAQIVTGRVLARQSAWDQEHRRIFTYTEIKVIERIAGEGAAPASVVVKTMGGEVGDIGMSVAGVAKFDVDEEVFLFLRADPVEPSQFQVIGMAQGKLRIVREPAGDQVLANVEGLAFVKRDATGTYKVDESIGPDGKMALAALKARITAARANKPAVTGPTVPAPKRKVEIKTTTP